MSQLLSAECETSAEFGEVECSFPSRAGYLPILAAEYVCPGESHPISRSIHLARLSSFYSKCRSCVHRDETGRHDERGSKSATQPVERPTGEARRAERMSLLETDGVRGVYLNELDRTRASEWGAALASLLWDQEPRAGDAGSVRAAQETSTGYADVDLEEAELGRNTVAPALLAEQVYAGRRGPVVVIGFDERPASPDIVTGVALGLRRMGCQVIDLGQTTAPCFQFAVSHLEATAGLFVTGAGCDPAWTGFDVVGWGGRPHSRGGLLDELESRAQFGVMRPTRTAGSQRTYQALIPYEAGLVKYFHALRPLHIAIGSSTKLFPRVVERLFARLPCRVTPVVLPVRQRDLSDAQDADVRRIAASVVSGGQHLGLIVDDDGQRCAFVTERGEIVSTTELARLLIELERREHPHLKVVATRALANELAEWCLSRSVEVVIADATAAAVAIALATSGARLGFLGDGRVWLGDSPPHCDALVTLARVLQALSLSDASFSDVVSRLKRNEV